MGKSTFALILSIISLSFGIIAIYASRPCGLHSNFVGTLIAIFSLLVTVLIGWNIYSVIDIKSETKNQEERLRQELLNELHAYKSSNKKEFEKNVEDLKRVEGLCVKMYEVVLHLATQRASRTKTTVDQTQRVHDDLREGWKKNREGEADN